MVDGNNNNNDTIRYDEFGRFLPMNDTNTASNTNTRPHLFWFVFLVEDISQI